MVGGGGSDRFPECIDRLIQVRLAPSALKSPPQRLTQVGQVPRPVGVVGGDGVQDALPQVYGSGDQGWIGGGERLFHHADGFWFCGAGED